MESRKLLNKLTNEELLEQIKNEEETVEEDYFNDFLSFISAFKIGNGEHRVYLTDLYKLYKEWSNNPLTRNSFSHEVGKYFTVVVTRGKRVVHIDAHPSHILKELYEARNKRNKTKSKVHSKPWINHFNAFLKAKNVEKGHYYLEAEIIYWLYDKWCYETKRKSHISYLTFIKFLDLNFERKRILSSRRYFYGVDEKIKEQYSEKFIHEYREKIEEENKEKMRKKRAKKMFEKFKKTKKENPQIPE
jgi:hypothetical protein